MILHQGHDVALARGCGRRCAEASKASQAVVFSEDAEELDRQAGDRAHGKRRAAAAVAVGPGQHQAGQRQALVESLGGAHRVLAGQRVGDQQGFGGLRDLRDLGRLVDHLIKASCAAVGCRSPAAWHTDMAQHGRGTPIGMAPACVASIASCSMAAGRPLTRRSARALQAGHQDHGRRVQRQVLGLALGTHRLHQRHRR